MSKITVMRSNFMSTDWKRAFADSLIQLDPDMNPDAADEVSDSEFLQAKDADPGEAAERYVARRYRGTNQTIFGGEDDASSDPTARAG